MPRIVLKSESMSRNIDNGYRKSRISGLTALGSACKFSPHVDAATAVPSPDLLRRPPTVAVLLSLIDTRPLVPPYSFSQFVLIHERVATSYLNRPWGHIPQFEDGLVDHSFA